MGNLRACLVITLAACGSSNNGPMDAPKLIDAAPDAKVFMDAAPDAPPNYDFTCLGMPLPTTAPATITVSGTTQELAMSGPKALGAVTVTANTTMVIGTTTSDMTTGAYTLTLTTNGVPINGYLEGVKVSATTTQYRTSFVYPPFPLAASATVPILQVSTTTFATLQQFAGATQNDANNGALFLAITDCKNMPVSGATLSVKQGAASVGTVFDLGALSAQAAGLYFVFNVPDGTTTVGATYTTTTFPTHDIVAHKKNGTDIANGSITLTVIRPRPLSMRSIAVALLVACSSGGHATSDAGSDATDAAVDADLACFSAAGGAGQCMTTADCVAVADRTATSGACAAPLLCCVDTPDVADNPPTPTGYKLMMQSQVTPAMTTWAVMILHDPVTYPMFSTTIMTFGTQMVLARVEWHPPDFQNNAVHRGVTLYVPG